MDKEDEQYYLNEFDYERIRAAITVAPCNDCDGYSLRLSKGLHVLPLATNSEIARFCMLLECDDCGLIKIKSLYHLGFDYTMDGRLIELKR